MSLRQRDRERPSPAFPWFHNEVRKGIRLIRLCEEETHVGDFGDICGLFLLASAWTLFVRPGLGLGWVSTARGNKAERLLLGPVALEAAGAEPVQVVLHDVLEVVVRETHTGGVKVEVAHVADYQAGVNFLKRK